MLTEAKLMKYIKKLRMGCASGIDGITAEHVKWASGTRVIKSLCVMLTLCIRFGIVPDSFIKGLLIPLIKKPNIDPSIPKHYRPIVISTTFSKLLEIHILEQCGEHEFDDLQFGFVSSRGTTMAAALTHDVIDYMKSRGSPVYVCSLDAEGAFDGIPHSILFKKALGVIPDMYWRILVYWYSRLVVQIKWGNKISQGINILKGTRQGGLSSPFLFNLFYQNMIDELSHMKSGICINNVTYNVFCYADDLLLCSASVSGLQKLIDKANDYITKHGLRFNPIKTECATFGKSLFNNRKWYLGGTCLNETDSIMYLGICLSNNNKAHSNARIKATRRAFYALQSAGVFLKGIKPETLIHIFNTAIRPVLLYGLQSIYQNNASVIEIEKLQAKLLKAVLGLKVFCRNTPLLDAMRVQRIGMSNELQELLLFRSMILSNSRTQYFYNFLLSQHIKGTSSSHKSLVSRVLSTCKKYDISLVNMMCDDTYLRKRKIFNQYPQDDGVVDSLRFLVSNMTTESVVLMNSILSPF